MFSEPICRGQGAIDWLFTQSTQGPHYRFCLGLNQLKSPNLFLRCYTLFTSIVFILTDRETYSPESTPNAEYVNYHEYVMRINLQIVKPIYSSQEKKCASLFWLLLSINMVQSC